ncbi:MAG: hypothetical protein ACLS89_05860 [Collinsella sp.]
MSIYKSYMLQEPVDQMRDFITDALRSSIPVYTLDVVFAKDDIAKDVNATVSSRWPPRLHPVDTYHQDRAADRGRELHERHQRRQRKRRCAGVTEADRIKRVTGRPPKTRRWKRQAKGINQRKAIALGVRTRSRLSRRRASATMRPTSCSCLRSGRDDDGVRSRGEAWTVVLPSDFSSASMFEQMLTAGKVQNESKE